MKTPISPTMMPQWWVMIVYSVTNGILPTVSAPIGARKHKDWRELSQPRNDKERFERKFEKALHLDLEID
jgi:hypothetical protein